jgi:predicted RNA-binding protein with RPS1 domain
MTDNKITQRDKVVKKYGAMVSYYGELLGLCHQCNISKYCIE